MTPPPDRSQPTRAGNNSLNQQGRDLEKKRVGGPVLPGMVRGAMGGATIDVHNTCKTFGPPVAPHLGAD